SSAAIPYPLRHSSESRNPPLSTGFTPAARWTPSATGRRCGSFAGRRTRRTPPGPRIVALRRLLLLVFVDFLEVGIDHVLALGLAAGATAARGAGLVGSIHGLAELHRSLRECVGLRLDGLDVLAGERRLQLGDRRLDRRLVGGRHLRAEIGERLLARMDECL